MTLYPLLERDRPQGGASSIKYYEKEHLGAERGEIKLLTNYP